MSQLICIECGCPTVSLHKKYSPTVLKLEQCKRCDCDVDKYVECDNAVVFMDIVLQEIPAYRHLLFNSEFKAFWKLGIVCIICNAYVKWAQGADASQVEMKSREFYLQVDWRFYYLLLQTFLDLALFILVTLFISWNLSPTSLNVKHAVQGLLLANYGQLFAIPAVIWNQNQSQAYLRLTELFILLSNIQVHRAVLGFTIRSALFAATTAFAAKLLFSYYTFDVFQSQANT